MQITANTTPFLAELFAPTDKNGVRHCVVVVKGSFTVLADGQCEPAADPATFVYMDQHYGDPGTTSILYESDFAPTKPRVDVLINANAIAPKRQPIRELEVALVGPGISKHAVVTGDRTWVESLSGFRPSAPKLFTIMPLVFERAFGGSDHSHERNAMNGTELRNPLGVGFHLNGDRNAIIGRPLPNIERPNGRQGSWSEKPAPVGFGVLGRGWQPRIGFAGTYDQRWLDEDFPFLPTNFDEHYFQSSSLDQQVAELNGGETFMCLHMSENSRFRVDVPKVSFPIRFYYDDRTESIRPRADTLIIEPERSRIIVLWRAGRPMGRKLTALREVQIGEPRRVASSHKRRYHGLAELISARQRNG